MSITRINEFQTTQEKSDELFVFLKSLAPYISSSDGCLSYDVLREHESDNCFIVIEKWQSIEAHKRSVDNFPKDEMLSAALLFGAPPKGSYYTS